MNNQFKAVSLKAMAAYERASGRNAVTTLQSAADGTLSATDLLGIIFMVYFTSKDPAITLDVVENFTAEQMEEAIKYINYVGADPQPTASS